MHTGFWKENLDERGQLKEPGVFEIIKLRRIIWKLNVGARTGSVWLRKGAGGGLL